MAETGVADDCAAALVGVDPIVRRAAARKVRRLLVEAERSTTLSDPAHLARLASVQLARGLPEASFDDVEGVRAEYAALPPAVAPRRGPWLTTLLACLIVALPSAGLLAWRFTRPFTPAALPGGALLGDGLTRYIVLLGARDPDETRAGLDAIRARVRGPEGQVAGAEGAARLTRLLDAADAVSHLASADDPGVRAATDAFFSAAQDVSAGLAQHGTPFYVDPDVNVTQRGVDPLLVTFYVEHEATAVQGSAQHRVVHLWRFDRLNYRQHFLGYTRPSSGAALVLLDQIESDLVRYVLPALPDGERLEIVDEQTSIADPPWARELTTRGAAALRRHFAAALQAPDSQLLRAGRLLAARRSLVRRWRTDLASLGLVFRVPERLVPEADYAEELRLRVPTAQRMEWDDLHDELMQRPVLAAFEAARADYAATVERHELQHRIDYGKGLRPLPDALARSLGVSDVLDTPEGGLAARSRDELSAYLASAASDESPLLALLLLARFGVDQNNLGGPYWYAAYHVFAGVAEELGLDPRALAGRGSISPERFSRLVLAVIDKEPAELRAALGRAYARTFGEGVPQVTVTVKQTNRPWRH